MVLPTIKMLVGPKITLEKSIFFLFNCTKFQEKSKEKKTLLKVVFSHAKNISQRMKNLVSPVYWNICHTLKVVILISCQDGQDDADTVPQTVHLTSYKMLSL